MGKLVREFSAIGPCLTLGEWVRETDKFIIYREWLGGDRFADRETRAGKGWSRHTEPCPRCRDHALTQYPDGYMD